MRARLARVILIVALLAGWQAALAHSIEHGGEAHEQSSLCDALDALTAAAAGLPAISATQSCAPELFPSCLIDAPRVAPAPPFLSQGPPAASV